MSRVGAAGVFGIVLVSACGGASPHLTTAKPTGTVVDFDGNDYPTIVIGSQEWMVENLKTTHYDDGAAILNVTDATLWYVLTFGAYAWYDNDDANKDRYGALYNWYVVDTNKICPAGWSVPSQDNWRALAASLGGDAVSGGRMKEAGTAHWQAPNTGATNESGFTALPAGWRSSSGSFVEQGQTEIWWTSTQDLLSLDPTADFWDVTFQTADSGGAQSPYQAGYSIRCRRSVN